MRVLALRLTLTTVDVAAAQPHDADVVAHAPDSTIARRHFERGRAMYEREDYAGALDEFTAANAIAPLPELEYNIARCHDRLDHPAEAIAAYRRYLATPRKAGDERADAERVALELRISMLTQRLPAPPAPSRPYLLPRARPRRHPRARDHGERARRVRRARVQRAQGELPPVHPRSERAREPLLRWLRLVGRRRGRGRRRSRAVDRRAPTGALGSGHRPMGPVVRGWAPVRRPLLVVELRQPLDEALSPRKSS